MVYLDRENSAWKDVSITESDEDWTIERSVDGFFYVQDSPYFEPVDSLITITTITRFY